jgi:sugar (pentulose or hexulose) kinase
MDGLFAGLDVSTQSCKLVVIDVGEQATVHVDVVAYDDGLPHYGTRDGAVQGLGVGASESDPSSTGSSRWIGTVILPGHVRSSGTTSRPLRNVRS